MPCNMLHCYLSLLELVTVAGDTLQHDFVTERQRTSKFIFSIQNKISSAACFLFDVHSNLQCLMTFLTLYATSTNRYLFETTYYSRAREYSSNLCYWHSWGRNLCSKRSFFFTWLDSWHCFNSSRLRKNVNEFHKVNSITWQLQFLIVFVCWFVFC